MTDVIGISKSTDFVPRACPFLHRRTRAAATMTLTLDDSFRDGNENTISFLVEGQKDGSQNKDKAEDYSLHAAAEAQSPKLLETLLETQSQSKIDGTKAMLDWQRNTDGSSPLHILVDSCKSSASAFECFRLLLNKKYHQGSMLNVIEFVNLKNSSGKTALDLCATHHNIAMASEILMSIFEQGQDHGHEFFKEYTHTDISPHWLEDFLSDIYKNIPLTMLPVLDKAFTRVKHGGNCGYSLFAGIGNGSESGASAKCIYKLLSHEPAVQTQILLHPFTLRYLKDQWKKVQPRVYISAAIQFAILLLYVAVAPMCTDADGCYGSSSGTMASGLTTILLAGLLVKEGFQYALARSTSTHHSTYEYFKRGYGYNASQIWFGVMAIISLNANVIMRHCDGNDNVNRVWLMSVIGILLAWLVTILQLRNLPPTAGCVSVFIHVTWKSVKMVTLFGLPTFIVFAQLFYILLPDSLFQTLSKPGVAVKLLSMYTGELTFDEIFKDTDTSADPNTLRYLVGLIIFALFAFIVTIVLLNLLFAFSVAITSDIVSQADTEVAKCQLEQIYFWETWNSIFRRRYRGNWKSNEQISLTSQVEQQQVP